MADDQKFFETAKFKAEQKKWYKKLKKDNFVDLESMVDLDGLLSGGPVIYNETTSEYFDAARQLLHTHKWQNALGYYKHDKEIWKLHSDGETIRAIAEKINKSHTYCLNRIKKYRTMIGYKE